MSFTFTKTTERLFLDTDYGNLKTSNYMMIEAYVKIDSDKYNKVWEDRLFKKHFAALLKKQWAQNLMKFAGVPLPGGAQINAPAIMQEAMREITEVENELLRNYELPVDPLIG
jgi:predicted alpha/beta-fold hydrolase